jgi:hypothetical protein
LLTAKHYVDYVKTQLGVAGDEATKLSEIDLRFDPYSDNPVADYDELKVVVESLNIREIARYASHPAAGNVANDPVTLPAYMALARDLIAVA